jgi:alpha-N-arabinofuranosidase
MNRRTFLSTSAYASAGLIAGTHPAMSADAEIEITVQPDGPEISPRLALMKIRCDELKVPSRTGTATMPGLSGSASTKDGTLHVTITNPSLESSITGHLRLSSGNLVEGRGTVLTHADMTAHNTFDKPNEIRLATLPVTVRSNRVEASIPQRAVVLLELKMTS